MAIFRFIWVFANVSKEILGNSWSRIFAGFKLFLEPNNSIKAQKAYATIMVEISVGTYALCGLQSHP